MKWWTYPLVFAFGVGSMFVLSRWSTNQKVAQLQHRGDSVTAAAHVLDSTTTRFADSVRHVVDSLQASKKPVTIKITIDSATAKRYAAALKTARTPRDSNVAYAAQVVALDAEIVGLHRNAHTDSLSLWKAMARGDSLQGALHDQTKTIADLNVEIQKLNHHALPRWVGISFDVAQKTLAVLKLVDIARGRPL